jgi:hypothetical protein
MTRFEQPVAELGHVRRHAGGIAAFLNLFQLSDGTLALAISNARLRPTLQSLGELCLGVVALRVQSQCCPAELLGALPLSLEPSCPAPIHQGFPLYPLSQPVKERRPSA